MTADWAVNISRKDGKRRQLTFSGRWCLDQQLPSPASIKRALDRDTTHLELSAAGLVDWDSGFVAFIAALARLCAEQGMRTEAQDLPAGVRQLLALAAAAPGGGPPGRGQRRPGWLERLGTWWVEVLQQAKSMLSFLGEITVALLRLLSGRARFRFSAFWLEIEEVGPRALIIVAVIAFLVGLILAYLGADQLRLVGAQIFIADLVAIGMVREMGSLMTGIIIAGRSGAAFAARLGTMQVNEEIDAFRTMSIQPVDFLVLPRFLALVLMVPLLTLYASFVGMLAGLLVAVTIFDLGVFEYYHETLRALQLKHFLVGLSKGSVYGAMVAYAGCLRGMECGRSAEAVGSAATSAVVTGILLITISATVMTIIYYQLGI